MLQKIDEQISVMALYHPGQLYPLPYLLKWQNRRYRINKVDLCHPVWEGKTLHHIFSVCDGTTYFRLNLNTRSQQWALEEISDGLPT